MAQFHFLHEIANIFYTLQALIIKGTLINLESTACWKKLKIKML